MKQLHRFILLLSALLFLYCGSRSTLVRKYYLIEADATIDSALLDLPEPFLVNAYISPVLVSEPYRGLRIALRSESNELVYYYYHYWADNPGEMATVTLHKAFLQAEVFKNCTRQRSASNDVMVSTSITVLERSREGNGEFARVAGLFKLVYLPQNTTLLTYPFDRRVRLRKDSNMNLFAGAVSRAFFNEAEEFIFRVADYYQYPPE